MRTLCGRADLVRLLAGDPTRNIDAAAALLGFVRPPPPAISPTLPSPIPPTIPPAPRSALPAPVSEPPDPLPLSPADQAPAAIPFWQPVQRVFRPDAASLAAAPPLPTEHPDLMPDPAISWPDQPKTLPPWPSLTPRPVLLTRLRTHITTLRLGSGPDIAAILHHLARARQIDRLPRRRQRRWGDRLHIIDDRSRRLTPFWEDQNEVHYWLHQLFPRHAVTHGRYFEGLTRPWCFGPDGSLGNDYALPPPGTVVLVLGDLGCLAPWSGPAAFWLAFGQHLRAAGCYPVALLPCPPARCPAALTRIWHVLAWEIAASPPSAPPSSDPAAAALSPVDQLLRLLSPAIRVEPGLLRQMRRLLGAGQHDAATEAEFWQHGAIASPSSIAASFHPDSANDGRRDFVALTPPARQTQALALIRTWRATLSPDVWFEEILSLPEAHRHGVPAADINAACTRFHNLSQIAVSDPRHSAALAAGVRGLVRRLPPDMPADLRQAADQFWAFLEKNNWAPAEKPPWGDIDPTHISPTLDHPARWLLYQQGNALSFIRDDTQPNQEQRKTAARAGSLIAGITSHNGFVTIAGRGHYLRGDALSLPQPSVAPLMIATDQETLTLDCLTQPSWADAIGRDRYGLWARFTVKGVPQCLRWIPPEKFLMGSPADEEGRWEYNGPQHLEVIDQGFWLFDTPCTQALWRAVMGENPSTYTGDRRRPVESVDWNAVQDFLQQINARVPGLDLILPSEQQWEYACRAGTSTATYGPLAEIAWYDDNSQLKPQPVAGKAANDWGLYDMLGNVWEWCADVYRPSGETFAVETSPLETEGAPRVVRGGSWINPPYLVRAASRFHYHPQNRYSVLGFRCARGQGEERSGLVW